MKKLAWLLMVLFLLTSTQVFASDLTDIHGHWAEDDIEFIYSQGIMTEKAPNVFSPDTGVSRAELAAYLVNVFGLNLDNMGYIKAPEPSDLFDDVSKEQWYSDAIMIACYNNIFEISDRKFKPEEAVSRIEVANSVKRAFEAKQISIITTQIWPNYIDTINIKDSDLSTINFMFNSGIMKGRSAEEFAPNVKITRAEMAVVLNKIIKIIAIYSPH